jgi:hypothetical protein
VLGIALALLVAGGALAKDGTKKVSGTISMVDASVRTLELKHGKNASKQTTFQLAPDTPVLSDGRPSSIGALAVGQRVTVRFAMEGPARMAKRVDVEPAEK